MRASAKAWRSFLSTYMYRDMMDYLEEQLESVHLVLEMPDKAVGRDVLGEPIKAEMTEMDTAFNRGVCFALRRFMALPEVMAEGAERAGKEEDNDAEDDGARDRRADAGQVGSPRR